MSERKGPLKPPGPPPSSASFEVGYAKPPAATRFRQGKSGNPRGRPKGARNRLPALNEERLKSIVLAEAYRGIKMRDGERNVTASMAEAVMRSVAVNAVKGHQRSQKLFMQLLEATERANKELHDEWLETILTYKAEWELEIHRCKTLGLEPPNPIPHPDHITLDMKTGTIVINGPFTPEEKATRDKLRDRKRASEAEIAEIERLLKNPRFRKHERILLEDLAFEKRLHASISRVIKD